MIQRIYCYQRSYMTSLRDELSFIMIYVNALLLVGIKLIL